MTYRNFTLICAVLLGLSLPSAAQRMCTQEMVRGTWIDSITGFMVMGTPAVPIAGAGLALFKIDEEGHLTASGPLTFGGQIASGNIAGTIKVNSDCTATANFTMEVPGLTPSPLPGAETLVVVDHGNAMWSMPTQEPLGQGITLETLRRISPGQSHCSSHTLVGSYGTTYQGYAVQVPPGQTLPVPAPYSYVGTALIDHQGRVSGGGTYSVGGTVMEVTLANATIEIQPDCTGTLHYSLVPAGSNQPLPQQGADHFVAFENGDEITLMTIQGVFGAPVTLGSMKRMSRDFWDGWRR
jgi:hypothetical protein